MSTDHVPEDPGRALVHEFRNLLAVIVNYSELIAEEADNPDAIKADIQEIRQAAERAIALTEKLARPAPPPASASSSRAESSEAP